MKLPSPRLRILLLLFALAAGRPLHAGYEIADVTEASENDYRGYTRVYLNYGDNPIEESEWEPFVPPQGYLKNSPRNGQFDDEETFGSPGKPAGEVVVVNIGEDANEVPYTWKFIAQIQSAMWGDFSDVDLPDLPVPIDPLNPYAVAAVVVTPPGGAIKFSSNEKNQDMIFWATEGDVPGGTPIKRYFITDEWGNKYIMGASGAPTDAQLDEYVGKAVLPNENWIASTGFFNETVHVLPAYGAGDQAHFNLFRDSGDNTYFQIEWSESGEGIASHIVDMPIWGGKSSDRILGRAGDDNLIHGAEGDDVIHLLGENDLVYGDAGMDTAVFTGAFTDYTLLFYANGGQELILEGLGVQKSLFSIESLQFEDRTIMAAAVPEPGALGLLAGVGLILSAGAFRRRARQRAVED